METHLTSNFLIMSLPAAMQNPGSLKNKLGNHFRAPPTQMDISFLEKTKLWSLPKCVLPSYLKQSTAKRHFSGESVGWWLEWEQLMKRMSCVWGHGLYDILDGDLTESLFYVALSLDWNEKMWLFLFTAACQKGNDLTAKIWKVLGSYLTYWHWLS